MPVSVFIKSAAKKTKQPTKRTYANLSRRTMSPQFIIICIILVMACVVVVGIFFSYSLAPEDDNKVQVNGYGVGVGLGLESPARTLTLNEKLFKWIPRSHLIVSTSGGASSGAGTGAGAAIHTDVPDWSIEFWTPIDIDMSSTSSSAAAGGATLIDPVVTLCKLNFKKYANSPHQYAMFRDLQGNSNCKSYNKKQEKLSVLISEINQLKGTPHGTHSSQTLL